MPAISALREAVLADSARLAQLILIVRHADAEPFSVPLARLKLCAGRKA